MARSRLMARDRVMLFGLGLGLVLGVAIGRKISSPVVVVVLTAFVFGCAWFALRWTRDARDRQVARSPAMEEESVEA